MIGIIMFFASLVMLLYGFPVAFTFAAVSLLFGVIAGIVEIGFDRNSVKLEFGEAYVNIALATKGEEHQEQIRENLKQNGYRFKQI